MQLLNARAALHSKSEVMGDNLVSILQIYRIQILESIVYRHPERVSLLQGSPWMLNLKWPAVCWQFASQYIKFCIDWPSGLLVDG